MNTLQIDSIGGASGNMILAALIDLGVDRTALTEKLQSLAVEETQIDIEDKAEHGLHGLLVTVHHDEGDHLPHRTLRDVRSIIESAPISAQTQALSLEVFKSLAEAEGQVHGKPADSVHFHEVGAIDAVIDIVGCCLALEMLEIDSVRVGTLPLGTGTTQCAHGIIPVPVPATVELLKGHPVLQTGEPFELVTPTGAALLATWARFLPFTPGREGTLAASGLGFGHRSLTSRTNCLRATLLTSADMHAADTEICTLLECNLDDISPELAGALTEKLFRMGALDVWTQSVHMKKQRSGIMLSILCKPGDAENLVDTVFRESTTFGIRRSTTFRSVLERRSETVETSFGPVRIKIGMWKGIEVTASPEYEDCAACANEHGVALKTVYTAALTAYRPGS